jgi:hypothetical protein
LTAQDAAVTKILLILTLAGALAQGLASGQSEPPLLIDSPAPLDAAK